jgi:hypothetical protein
MQAGEMRSTMADALAGEHAPSAETLNMACFWLSLELNDMEFVTPEARDVARTLLRTAGRVIIDAASEGADAATWPNTREMVVEWVNEMLESLDAASSPFSGDVAPPAPEGWAPKP